MDSDTRTVVLNGATSQLDRWRAALDPGYARADDRSLPVVLDFAARFGCLINYYDFENTLRGDWGEFFARDPILALASIATTDIAGMERDVARLARRAREARTERSRRALLDAALELPRQVNRWLDATSERSDSATARLVHTRLAADIRDRLGPQLRWFQAHEEIDGTVEDIVAAWQPIADAVNRWSASAPGHIATALSEHGGHHQPHVALFIAFAHLLGTAQESINHFSSRRADFYFRRVLRDGNQPAVPDSVHVAFDAARSPVPIRVTVPRHTLLSAGRDAAGQDLHYASCDDVTVTGARLAIVRTVRVVSGPLLARGADDVLQRVVSRELTHDEANAGGFPTFGDADDRPAAIGFAISSPSLWLRGGTRNITLEVRCAKMAPAADDALTRLNLATGLDNDFILHTLLLHAFTLSVSTATGWREVDAYAVDLVPGLGGPGFTVRFALGPEVPPIAPCPDSPIASAVPALRALLRQERVSLGEGRSAIGVYPLSVLAGLAVVSLDVHVEVSELAPAGVENPVGAVDTTKPFPAFGAVPSVGSYLRLRDPELFSKDVSRLALRITWFDVPTNDTGFQGYYRGYVIGPNGLPQEGLFDNQVFRAAAVVEPGGAPATAPQDDEQQRYLFRTATEPSGSIPEADRKLSRWTRLEDLPIVRNPDVARSGQSQDSLRLELTAPPYAFGNSLYTQNMLHASLAVQSESACQASCQAEYAFLLHAARSLESVLPPSTPAGIRGRLVEATRAFRGLRTSAQTVDSNKVATLRALADAAYESLSSCLIAWRDRFPEQHLLALRTQLAEGSSGTPAERLAALTRLRSQLRDAAAPAGTDTASSHLDRCDLVFLAASWVEDSDAGYRTRASGVTGGP